MNFRTQVDPPAIFTTGAAVDGSTVFGSLKMARAALDDAVDTEIACVTEMLSVGILGLKTAAAEAVRDLRAARKAALKVREGDLQSDDQAPDEPSGPNAAMQEGIALHRQLTQSGPAQEAPSAASHTPAPDPAPAGGADTVGAPAVADTAKAARAALAKARATTEGDATDG